MDDHIARTVWENDRKPPMPIKHLFVTPWPWPSSDRQIFLPFWKVLLNVYNYVVHQHKLAREKCYKNIGHHHRFRFLLPPICRCSHGWQPSEDITDYNSETHSVVTFFECLQRLCLKWNSHANVLSMPSSPKTAAILDQFALCSSTIHPVAQQDFLLNNFTKYEILTTIIKK